MEEKIVLKLDLKEKESLAIFRMMSSIEVTEHNGYIWLRSTINEENEKAKFHSLRYVNWYLLKDDYLFERGKNTPEMILFEAKWQPVHLYIPVTLPTAAFGGKAKGLRVQMTLKDFHEYQEPVGILTTKMLLEKYIESAPSFRFHKLKYIENVDGDIFLLGKPLLPIQGVTYWQYQNVLLPNGKILKSKLHLEVLQSIEEKKNDIYYFINSSSEYQTIDRANFKPLTRKAIAK